VRTPCRAPDRRRASKIGFVFQRPVLLRRSALANVEYALAIAGVARPARGERALGALERARLAHLAHVPARVLSGGASSSCWRSPARWRRVRRS
jgi:tungstate transport system ATP-binding protein